MQKKLKNLLAKYSLPQNVTFIDELTATINGKEVHLLSWRFERRFIEFKKIVESKYAVGISAFKIHKNIKKGQCLFSTLLSKIDLCEWILQARVERIFCVEGESALNSIIVLDNKSVGTIELAFSDIELDKHEAITCGGIICDKVVDTQIPQSSIYLYNNLGCITFTDTDFELYDATPHEVACIRAAFTLSQNISLQQSHNMVNERLLKIEKAARQSAKGLVAVNIGGQYEPY